jgi:hypothetical protein
MVEKLSTYPVRIFSIDLPYHGKGYKATDALECWAAALKEGSDVLTPFLSDLVASISFLSDTDALIATKTAVAGLSRGAFVATYVAAELAWLQHILGFAPLTQMSYAKEFSTLQRNKALESLSLFPLVDKLVHKKLRYYISNHDTRVGTASCMTLIDKLGSAAHSHGVRSAAIELIVSAPIGYKGHGTSREVFEEGALWLARQLEVEP